MSFELDIVPRAGWKGRAATATEPMATPVPYVIIHHSYIPPACATPDECCQAMRTMQDMHQLTNRWNDVGYSFAVGGDGRAYEGRGWSHVGAHAPRYNNVSIGICVIGDWREKLPPPRQLAAVHNLIALGVDKGMIRPDYTLLGHRQVRDTECPGDRFFAEITTWDHFSPISYPSKVADGKPLGTTPHPSGVDNKSSKVSDGKPLSTTPHPSGVDNKLFFFQTQILIGCVLILHGVAMF